VIGHTSWIRESLLACLILHTWLRRDVSGWLSQIPANWERRVGTVALPAFP